MACRCDTVTELYGQEAEDYAGEHLRSDGSVGGRFEEQYSCPDTGRRWKLDYPERTEREPGPARLVAHPG
jgi:hypothetical protein